MDNEWYLLTWDGDGWNMSGAMEFQYAKHKFDMQQKSMPNCPARLVCLETTRTNVGIHPEALKTPLKPWQEL